MYHTLKKIFLAGLICWSASSCLFAQKNKIPLTREEKKIAKQEQKAEKQLNKKRKWAEQQFYKEQQLLFEQMNVTSDDVVYIFGVGTNFNDSTVYLTNIIPLDSIKLDKKSGFLPGRTDFSLQFRQYLEGSLGCVHETTCVFFSDKRKKISKYYYKLKKRYLNEGYKDIIVVDPKQFIFQRPAFLKSNHNS